MAMPTPPARSAARAFTGAPLHWPERDRGLDVDFVVLGPVLATPTHPDARPLGWEGFAGAVAGTRVPVFALGGLHREDLETAVARGAHGIAMRRHAWPAG